MDNMINFLAQQQELPPEAVGVFVAFLGVAIVIGLAIAVLICWLIYAPLKTIPAQYRVMEPGMVWLLLIPCFNLVWNFFVYLRIPDSFNAFFQAHQRTEFGDCGRGLGLAYAICAACSIVPLINYLAGPASLVLAIIVIVKFWTMKKAVEQCLASGAPAGDEGDQGDEA